MTKPTITNLILLDLNDLLADPVIKASGKFVLVRQNGDSILAMGRIEQYEYHAQILADVCDRRDIAAFWIRQREYLEVYDRDVTVAGGGWFDLDPDRQHLKFYGYSTAYGSFDDDLLSAFIEALPQFRQLTIAVP